MRLPRCAAWCHAGAGYAPYLALILPHVGCPGGRSGRRKSRARFPAVTAKGETPDGPSGSQMAAGDSQWSGRDRSSIFGLYPGRFVLHHGHHLAKPESARMPFGLRSGIHNF